MPTRRRRSSAPCSWRAGRWWSVLTCPQGFGGCVGWKVLHFRTFATTSILVSVRLCRTFRDSIRPLHLQNQNSCLVLNVTKPGAAFLSLSPQVITLPGGRCFMNRELLLKGAPADRDSLLGPELCSEFLHAEQGARADYRSDCNIASCDLQAQHR